MRRICKLVLAGILLSGFTGAQTGSVVFTPASTEGLLATAGALVCNITPGNTPVTVVNYSCKNSGTPLPTFQIPIGTAGLSVTYSMTLGGNSITAIYTQSNPTGTVSYSATANGSTPATAGNF